MTQEVATECKMKLRHFYIVTTGNVTELEVERLHAKTKLNSVSVWVLKRTNKLKLLVKVKIELTNSIQGETLTLKEHFYIACVRLKKNFYRLMNYSQLFRATTIKNTI